MREPTTSRPQLTVDPITGPGGYAVPDPDDPGRLTFWWVQNGRMRRYPWDTRWEPTPPLFGDVSREERAVLRDAWYEDRYWPWKRVVAARIMEAPSAARRAFADRYPRVELPPAIAAELNPVATGSGRKVTRARQVWAACGLRAGRSVRGMASLLDVSWQTARDWAAAGDGLLTEDPAVARQEIVEQLGSRIGEHILTDRSAELLAEGHLKTFDVVTQLLVLRGAL